MTCRTAHAPFPSASLRGTATPRPPWRRTGRAGGMSKRQATSAKRGPCARLDMQRSHKAVCCLSPCGYCPTPRGWRTRWMKPACKPRCCATAPAPARQRQEPPFAHGAVLPRLFEACVFVTPIVRRLIREFDTRICALDRWSRGVAAIRKNIPQRAQKDPSSARGAAGSVMAQQRAANMAGSAPLAARRRGKACLLSARASCCRSGVVVMTPACTSTRHSCASGLPATRTAAAATVASTRARVSSCPTAMPAAWWG